MLGRYCVSPWLTPGDLAPARPLLDTHVLVSQNQNVVANLPSGCLPRCLCVFSSENRMKTRTTHCQKPSGFSQNQSLPVFPETVVGALCSDATEPHLGEYLVTWPPLVRLWAHVRVPCTPSVLLEDWQCFLHLPSTFCGG